MYSNFNLPQRYIIPPNHHKSAKYTVLNLKFEHLIVQVSKPQFLKRKQLNLFHIVTILNVSNNIHMQDPIIHVSNWFTLTDVRMKKKRQQILILWLYVAESRPKHVHAIIIFYILKACNERLFGVYVKEELSTKHYL